MPDKPVRDAAVACSVLPARDTSVVGRLRDGAGGLDLILELSDEPMESSGDLRFQLAIEKLCLLDALILRKLHQGREVVLSVPAEMPRRSGPYRAIELVAPLLRELPRVDARLYGYQREGVAWLLSTDRALLGDDMGLGKSAQALTALAQHVAVGAVGWALLVAPRTLVANWIRESELWAPSLAVSGLLPTGADRENVWSRQVGRAHLVVTSYEQLRSPPLALITAPPDLIIADEAHRLRNAGSQASQGFRTLESTRVWALTGTPIERDPEDLAVLMSLIEPARFSPDDKTMDAVALRARVRPYVLRRRKSDVLDQLPDVVETEEVLDLTVAQRHAYSRAVRAGARNPEQFLALFGMLRRICDVDPSSGASSKLDRIVELLFDIRGDGEKCVVFSYELLPLERLSERIDVHLGPGAHSVLTGSMSISERQASLSKFRESSEVFALLASTRVGSEGLNLTEANHVVFVNRWWNPSSNSQARDRVVRIGQRRAVNVRSFTCRGTVEERIPELLARKKWTFRQLIDYVSMPGPGNAVWEDLLADNL